MFSKQRYFFDENSQQSEELKKVKEELEKVKTELQQFAYIASHDLQEPLRTITTYSNFLSKRYKDKLDDEAKEFIDFIQSSGKKIQEMVSGLLDYSRVQTKGQELAKTDLNLVVQEALISLNTPLKETNFKINIENLPFVLGDTRQLQEAFFHLFENAIKFKRKDVIPELSVSGKIGKDFLIVSVEDNGIGIKEEFYDRVFLLFQRLHTYSEIPGRGIGLTLAKKIIERHGGKVWIESKLNSGTKINFTLNLAK